MTRVLLVDDEAFVRQSVVNGIDWAAGGFEIACAGDGEEALELLAGYPADVILTDMKMPRMDGLCLLERLEGQGRMMEIIILSCYNEFDLVRKAMTLGATDYLFKPTMYPRDILASVQKARERLEKRRASVMKPNHLLEVIEGKLLETPEELQWERECDGEMAAGCRLLVVRVEHIKEILVERFGDNAHLMMRRTLDALRRAFGIRRALARGSGEYVLLAADNPASFGQSVRRAEAELDVRLYLGVSCAVGKAAQLRAAYRDAEFQAQHAMLKGEKIMLADAAGRHGDRIAEAVAYMSGHLDDPSLSLQMLAERAGMSKNYFANQFKERMGENFVTFLTRLRVRKAKELYQHTDMKIYEISEAVGYADWHYLYQVYKKHEGHSLSHEKRLLDGRE